MSLPLATFLPDVAIEVADCPQLIIQHHTVKVLADFCKQSRYLMETLPLISAVAGQASYVITPSEIKNLLVRVEQVWFDGEPLDPITVPELDAEMPDWQTTTGTPHLYTWADDALQLVPIPETDAANTIKVRISYTLKVSAVQTEFPDILYDRFSQGIAAGIKASLMTIPGKAWSNPKLAAGYQRDFQVAVALAKGEGRKGLSRARRRTATYYR